MRLKPDKSFTLVELLVAAYVLLIGICGMLLLFVNSMRSSDSAWDTTVATSHAESILEEMQSEQSLSDVVAANWDQWAQNQNLKTLPQEEFHVVFTDPAADPLDIKVLVQWQRGTGTKKITLNTKLTK